MKMSLINLNTSQMEQILSLLEDMYYLSYPQSQQKLNKYVSNIVIIFVCNFSRHDSFKNVAIFYTIF